MTPHPTRARLEASSFCQLRCPSCPTTSGAIHPAIGSGRLRQEDFARFLDLNRSLESVELSNYGEVFLNPELPEILALAAARGVAITFDNGVNLNQARDEVLEALVLHDVRSLTCSIDGASPETYAIYRVRGDFDRVIAHVARINHFKQVHGSELPRLTWQFIVFGHNEHEIAAARAMALRLGMRFKTKISWDSKISPIRDRAAVLAETGRDAVTREEYEAAHGRKYLDAICHQLWDDPQVNWDGRLLGCCRNFWGDFGANAFAQDLASCLASEKMGYARAMLRGEAPARDDIPCTTCEMYIAMRDRGRWIDRPEPGVATPPAAPSGMSRAVQALQALRRLFRRQSA
jgi:MoaA/NifB/PqqE/SkfB family radical SAM enzyme